MRNAAAKERRNERREQRKLDTARARAAGLSIERGKLFYKDPSNPKATRELIKYFGNHGLRDHLEDVSLDAEGNVKVKSNDIWWAMPMPLEKIIAYNFDPEELERVDCARAREHGFSVVNNTLFYKYPSDISARHIKIDFGGFSGKKIQDVCMDHQTHIYIKYDDKWVDMSITLRHFLDLAKVTGDMVQRHSKF
jgi:hypothetical protein